MITGRNWEQSQSTEINLRSIDMAYVRKTRDEYQIQQYTSEGWEEVCAEETMKAAKQTKKEYRDNQPEYPVRIVKKRVRI
jgi:hypothetical protein